MILPFSSIFVYLDDEHLKAKVRIVPVQQAGPGHPSPVLFPPLALGLA